jgi:SAM-dependent methyltransferase
VTSGEPPEPQTWHYGLVAKWWAEFNTSGPEIPYFRRFVEAGEPALDVACGTGRLLVPFLEAGLDVDGCDVSEDMLALCRERAEPRGLTPDLYAQAMHKLELPRRYRTIYVCGGFGLGGRRDHDVEALRRFHDHLEPGGTLVLDNEPPYACGHWRYWRKGERGALPRPWPEAGDRRRASDGDEYELRSRVLDLDPLAQRVTLQIKAGLRRDGELIAEEEHVLKMTLYFKDELVLMLERVGFRGVEVRAGYTDAEPSGEDDFLVFSARKAPREGGRRRPVEPRPRRARRAPRRGREAR